MVRTKKSKTHKKEYRPWGYWSVLLESADYKVKKIIVKPGHSLSLQSHKYRSEHWIVVSGNARIKNGNRITLLKKGQSAFIAARKKHRLSNPGKLSLKIIEIQNGEYLGEDDIVRYEDKYGRA